MLKGLTLALFITLLSAGYVFAGDIYLNDVVVGKDITAVEKDGLMYAPLRKIADLAGAKLEWNDKTKTVIIYNPFSLKSEILAEVTVAYKEAVVYSLDTKKKTAVEMEAAAFIKDSHTYIPISFITKSLGFEYVYDDKTGDIYLTY